MGAWEGWDLQALVAEVDGAWSERHPADVDVYKKPFLFYQLALLKKHNVAKVLVVVRRFGKRTQEFVKKSFKGFPIEYEWLDEPLTSARLKVLADRLDDMFFVTRHDRFLPVDYYLLWRWFTMNPAKMLGTVVVSRPTERYRPNLYADLGVKLVRSYGGERKNLLDYGVSLLRKEAVMDSAGDEDLRGLHNRLAEAGQLGAFLSDKHFFDATEEGVKGLRRYLLYSQL